MFNFKEEILVDCSHCYPGDQTTSRTLHSLVQSMIHKKLHEYPFLKPKIFMNFGKLFFRKYRQSKTTYPSFQ